MGIGLHVVPAFLWQTDGRTDGRTTSPAPKWRAMIAERDKNTNLAEITTMTTGSYSYTMVRLLCPRPRREGVNKRCFCPSVRPSVSVRPSLTFYIANNSRTQRPSVPEFGRKVPHLRCDSHTGFKVKRSKMRVTRPMLTHIVHHIFRTARQYELQSWYSLRAKDDDPHQPQAPWLSRSKVKVARSRDQSEPCRPNGP